MSIFSKQKGFTLIELLVVIAIIGLLSAIVLASFSTARTKGRNAAAQASLSSIRAQNELFFNSTTNYGAAVLIVQTDTPASSSACNQVQTINLLKSINTNTGKSANCAVGLNGTTWVAWTQLVDQTGTQNYCADNTGFSGVRTLNPIYLTYLTTPVNCASS